MALFTPSAIPVLGDIMRYTISPILAWLTAPLLIRRLFAPRPVTPRFRAEFPVSMTLRPMQLRAFSADSAYLIPSAAALSRRFGELRMPIFILGGAADRIVGTERHGGDLHAALPRSRFRVLRGIGHMLHHEAPDAVLEAVDAIASERTAPAETVAADGLAGDDIAPGQPVSDRIQPATAP